MQTFARTVLAGALALPLTLAGSGLALATGGNDNDTGQANANKQGVSQTSVASIGDQDATNLNRQDNRSESVV